MLVVCNEDKQHQNHIPGNSETHCFYEKVRSRGFTMSHLGNSKWNRSAMHVIVYLKHSCFHKVRIASVWCFLRSELSETILTSFQSRKIISVKEKPNPIWFSESQKALYRTTQHPIMLIFSTIHTAIKLTVFWYLHYSMPKNSTFAMTALVIACFLALFLSLVFFSDGLTAHRSDLQVWRNQLSYNGGRHWRKFVTSWSTCSGMRRKIYDVTRH